MDGLLRIEPCIVCRGEQAHRSTASAFVYAAVAARAAGRREASHRVTVWIRNFGGCSSLNVPLLQRHSIYIGYVFKEQASLKYYSIYSLSKGGILPSNSNNSINCNEIYKGEIYSVYLYYGEHSVVLDERSKKLGKIGVDSLP